MTSPLGFHKSGMADLDTDAQTKSKIYSNQMVIDDKLSLILESSEFRNMARKYVRNLMA